MHRTTTTATLLVTMAVSALSGCVTVQHPPSAPGSPGVPSPPSEPRPDGVAETQVVQAPAREALELIGPPRRSPSSAPPAPRAAAPTPAATPAAAPEQQPTVPRPRTERPAAPKQHHPKPRHPEPHRPELSQPHVTVPPVPEALPENTDVCALGRKYGGWGKDTPQAVICKDMYGR
ncbi:hypothetical protein [Streptomyces sp. NPDC002845]